MMRTLRLGDRTISYDTGLDMVHTSGPPGILVGERKISVPYSEVDSGAGSDCSEDHEEVENERKLIKPDMIAISQLLNFDEEDEDDLTDSDEEEDKPRKENIKWQKAVVKDLANLDNGDVKVKRRHSISKCETVKVSQSEVSAGGSLGRETSCSYSTVTPTLNLSLCEVGHIRSVLVRAEIEALPTSDSVKEEIVQGKICSVCTSTRFGIFHLRRAQKCEVCHMAICFKCCTRMRIPEEQFSAIPVEVLSPLQEEESISAASGPASLCISELANCAGSAPNTPKTGRKKTPLANLSARQLLSEQLNSLPPPTTNPLPSHSKYSTLPKVATRRWSLISSREKDRQRLEGSLLTVCTNCEGMVKQVIRTSGQNRRVKSCVARTSTTSCT